LLHVTGISYQMLILLARPAKVTVDEFKQFLLRIAPADPIEQLLPIRSRLLLRRECFINIE
jgi:hypothetical protein